MTLVIIATEWVAADPTTKAMTTDWLAVGADAEARTVPPAVAVKVIFEVAMSNEFSDSPDERLNVRVACPSGPAAVTTMAGAFAA
jgi:hypothetical protein